MSIKKKDGLKDYQSITNEYDDILNVKNMPKKFVFVKKSLIFIFGILFIILLLLISILSYVIINNRGKETCIYPYSNRDINLENNPYSFLPFYNKSPHFDFNVGFGPEAGNNRFNINVILNSFLLNEEDKLILESYKNELNTLNISNVNFQICLGINDGIDFIFLISNYYLETEGEIIDTFLFKSNLPYTFNSLIEDYKTITGEELSNNKYYFFNSNNILYYGITLNFIETYDGFYQEYYIAKTSDRRVFIINKYNQIDE